VAEVILIMSCMFSVRGELGFYLFISSYINVNFFFIFILLSFLECSTIHQFNFKHYKKVFIQFTALSNRSTIKSVLQLLFCNWQFS